MNENQTAETAGEAISLRLELEQCRERIAELTRAETLLAGENRVLEAVASGVPLPEILTAVCRLIEEQCDGGVCSILLFECTGSHVEHAIAPGLPPVYNQAIHGLPVKPEVGPCALAACAKQQVIVRDIESDPRWQHSDWRRLALANRLWACWSTPILACNEMVLGTFAIYWQEPCSPTAHDQQLIAQITHLAAVVIERRRIEEQLRRSEGSLTEAIDTIPGLVWSVQPDGEVDFLNQRWREYTGMTLEQARGWGWRAAIHPGDLAELEAYWRSVLASGRAGEIEARLRRHDGTFRWFLFRAVPLHDSEGRLAKWYGQNIDIDERRRAETLLAGEKQVLEMIARGDELPPILDALCRLAEVVVDDSLAAILLLNPEDNRLWHAASPSLPVSYTDGMGGVAVGPAVGSCGTAAFRREPVIVCDIATDPLWVEYRNVALAHGLRASWSTPILSSGGRLLGTFAILAREPRSPTPQHHHLTGQLTHLASIAIERTQSEAALRAANARFAGILEIADDAIISVDASQRIVLFNQGAEKMFGYTQSEVAGHALDMLLPQRFGAGHRGHLEAFAKSPEVARTMAQRREVFGRRKDGGEFPAEASISKLDLGGELVFTVILRDITERKQSAEALRASEHLARGQVDALKRTLDALATESDPDRLVEHILCAITEQFGAHSSSVWRRDEASGMIGFEFAFEGGKVVPKTDARFAGMNFWLPMEDFWPWPEVFRTGKPSVIEDIQTVPPFALRGRLLPWGIVTVLLVPLFVTGRLEGAISLRFTRKRSFRPEELELAQALANQATLAMQLANRSAQSRQMAITAERNRMARDLHDTLAQGFTGVIMQLEATKGAMINGDATAARTHIERAETLARASLGEARRSVRAMRSRSLVAGTLSTALDELLKRMTSGTELQAELVVQGESRALPQSWEEGLLRIAQESLTNTIKYAHAAHFRATLSFTAHAVQVQLADDGRGFDPNAEHEGFGLIGMKERAGQMGGNFVLRSNPGQGTEIVVELRQASRKNGNHED